VIALIPAYNDAYALYFCLSSIVDFFDKIIVLDDASFDETAAVAFDFQRRYANVELHVNRGEMLGWVEARKRLMRLAGDAANIFFIDADDVFCEYRFNDLKEIVDNGRPCYLRHFDLWGDFHHGTSPTGKLDVCHLYVPTLECCRWTYRTDRSSTMSVVVPKPTRTDNVLFVHMKGVKPDFRIYLRHYMKPWIRAGRPYPLVEWCDLNHMTPSEIHREATRILLTSPRTMYRINETWPNLPTVIKTHLDDFQFIYQDGKIVDRAVDYDSMFDYISPI